MASAKKSTAAKRPAGPRPKPAGRTTPRAGDAAARARRNSKGKPEAPTSKFFAAVQRACLAFPGAVEEYPWGDVVWKVNGKMFAATGTGNPMGVTVKPAPETRLALSGHPAVAVAKYVGRYGWITVTIADNATRDLAIALCRESYDTVTAG